MFKLEIEYSCEENWKVLPVEERIVSMLLGGNTYEVICVALGVSSKTVAGVNKKYPELKDGNHSEIVNFYMCECGCTVGVVVITENSIIREKVHNKVSAYKGGIFNFECGIVFRLHPSGVDKRDVKNIGQKIVLPVNKNRF